MKIAWTDEAVESLAALHDYIAHDSPTYADRFVERLLAAVDQLETFPDLGRHVPEAPVEVPGVREILFHTYRVIYRREAERVLILTVLHGSRNLAGQEPKPWELA
jgi:plasmid stabilization system protein ParE